MVNAAGIDPGTGSMDLFGFDDKNDRIFLDLAIPRAEVTKNPRIVLEALKNSGRDFDAIVGPAGYGLPLVKAADATSSQIKAATFITIADEKRRLNIVGLRELMFAMRDCGLPIWFPPGVIHLPTVPEHRKINRIDMGTSDKVFSAVYGIRDQAERLEVGFDKTSFILLEAGFGYLAALAVEGGQIVDGVGGTVGGLGYMSMGGMDGELAYALANIGEFSKTMLFTGGAASIAGIDPKKTSIEEFLAFAKESEEAKMAYAAFLESILKDTFLMLASVPKPKEILLSGRFTRNKDFVDDASKFIGTHLRGLGVKAKVRTLSRRGKNVKEAAVGAATMASGLSGGRYEKLVDNMRLRESAGGVFSHIRLGEEINKKIAGTFS
jgi:predicted butyrate kinase (DUF1464 family)